MENLPLSVASVARVIPDIQSLCSGSTTSLHELKTRVNATTDQQLRKQQLAALSAFIAGETFYQLVKDHPTARAMQQLFEELCQEQPDRKIIVRSSGAREDGYGDAQAGKYESLVHGEDDIVRTCLKVLASGYRPEVCASTMPAPMALVMQHCVDCRFGGVAMSYTGFKDNRVQIEFVPGQPKGAVAGQFGITPHRYTISRGHNITPVYTAGNVTSTFVLDPQGNNTAAERLAPIADGQSQTLPESSVRQLYRYIEQLENLLGCPVDVEFAINHQGEVVILQVRPMTRLCGGRQFSAARPAEFICSGRLVSEGLCQGPLIRLQPGESSRHIPQGAIIMAPHCELWMLAPEVLAKAGGFVFQQGGSGDHVAITLLQAGKPCVVTGTDEAAGEGLEGQQVTLVCGQFDQQSGAFLLAGSQVDQFAESMLPTVSGDFSTAIAYTDQWQPAEHSPMRVDEQFRELNRLNGLLLHYFSRDRLLNQCLSSDNNLLLSMSPQRAEVLLKLEEEIAHLLADTDALLLGYEQYLLTGAKGEETTEKITTALASLEVLKGRVNQIQKRVATQLVAVTAGLTTAQELLPDPVCFRQWRMDCVALRDSLLQLSLPRQADEVDSIHDIVFLIHQWFVDMLGDIAVASGQGETIKKSKKVTMVNFPSPHSADMLGDKCATALEEYGVHNTVLNMDGVCIINTKIKYHKGVIEVIENGPGGKGRTLKIRMVDDFRSASDLESGAWLEGKLKRFFELALLMNAVAKSHPGQSCDIAINESIGEIVCEISRVPSINQLQDQLLTAIKLLNKSTNEDMCFSRPVSGMPLINNFTELKSHIGNLDREDDQWILRSRLFDIGSDRLFKEISDLLCSLFGAGKKSNIIRFASRMSEKKHESPELSDDDFTYNQECIQTFLIVRPQVIISQIKAKTDWLSNKQLMLPLVKLNGRLLEYLSCELKQDREIVLNAAAHAPEALLHADEKFWDDPEVLRAAANACKDDFIIAVQQMSRKKLVKNAMLQLLAYPITPPLGYFEWEPYGDDKSIMHGLVKNGEPELMSKALSEALRDDTDFFNKAKDINKTVIRYASERIRNDYGMV
ncbi:PEP/pyruvate-binding domain-containing protein [Endozoicomonas acroporae]|uniref:PEP/pyruvate-binding domain-containing protein n=1 Tax=Endozoicomonas acroporae TaxID=1701104 RepID=UPI000C77B0B6|nr:PEP/pyruvate-binding domain-containing protein [Endozoicomonas acroporae]